jgi:hypothetical protein
MEVMMYLFVLPGTESKVSAETIELCLDLIGNSLLPFLRASAQLRWEMSPFGSQLIFRQNSQFTAICRMILRLFGKSFADMMTSECRRILEEAGPKIKAAPIADDEDALTFIEKIFEPFVNFFLSSIARLPNICRVLHRLLLVRASGFYVEQNAAFLVVPNLLFLRFLIPPIAEETTIAYAKDPKMRRIASLLSGSLLSLCNELGWPADKEPYMAKFVERVAQYYPKLEEFTFQLIDCHEWDYDVAQLHPKGELVDLLSSTVNRVILMDAKEANKFIHSHIYCASLMHMIEESVYDFSGVEISKTL